MHAHTTDNAPWTMQDAQDGTAVLPAPCRRAHATVTPAATARPVQGDLVPFTSVFKYHLEGGFDCNSTGFHNMQGVPEVSGKMNSVVLLSQKACGRDNHPLCVYGMHNHLHVLFAAGQDPIQRTSEHTIYTGCVSCTDNMR